MRIPLEPLASNIERITRQLGMTVAELSAGAGLARGWAGKALNGDFDAKAYKFLRFLASRGISGRELLLPAVSFESAPEKGTYRAPAIKRRPSIEEMTSWMRSCGHDLDWNSPLLEFCNVFRLSKRGGDPVCVATGRYAALAIEAGITTPGLMEKFIENSDAREYGRIFQSMSSLKNGQTRVSPRLVQTLYIPPSRFELHGVDTVKHRCGVHVVSYGLCLACSSKDDPAEEYAGRDFPALLSVRSLQDVAPSLGGLDKVPA